MSPIDAARRRDLRLLLCDGGAHAAERELESLVRVTALPATHGGEVGMMDVAGLRSLSVPHGRTGMYRPLDGTAENA